MLVSIINDKKINPAPLPRIELLLRYFAARRPTINLFRGLLFLLDVQRAFAEWSIAATGSNDQTQLSIS